MNLYQRLNFIYFQSAQMELVLFLFDLSGTLITSLISLYLVVLFSYIPALYQQGLCNTVALPFTFKSIFKPKEELLKLKYFTMQKYNLQKIL
jgi:hypothetical protein